MTRGAISKLIDKLQAKGWIVSKVKAEDNRVQLLSLTSAGRRVVPELAALADENDENFFGALHAAERRSLRSLLMKLASQNQIRNVPTE